MPPDREPDGEEEDQEEEQDELAPLDGAERLVRVEELREEIEESGDAESTS